MKILSLLVLCLLPYFVLCFLISLINIYKAYSFFLAEEGNVFKLSRAEAE